MLDRIRTYAWLSQASYLDLAMLDRQSAVEEIRARLQESELWALRNRIQESLGERVHHRCSRNGADGPDVVEADFVFETDENRRALSKVGPVLEAVKKELGIGGAG